MATWAMPVATTSIDGNLRAAGEIVPTLALGYFGWRRCSRAPQHATRNAMWIAFYMTVPLFTYGYLYLAVHQQRGWAFLQTQWYLTAFYVIPWLLLPPIAWRARQAKQFTSSVGNTTRA